MLPAFLGYSRDEFLAMTIKDIRPPETLAQLEAHLDAVRTEPSGPSVWQHQKKDGAVIDVEISASNLQFSGRPARLVLASDVTDRQRAEHELSWKTAFLEAQVTSSLDGILVVNGQGQKVLQNQRFNDLLKIPQDIVDNTDDWPQLEWVTAQTKNPAQFAGRVAYLIKHRDEVSREEIELVDGTLLDRYSAPVVGENGTYYGRIWTFRDVTERVSAERTLRESEARYRSLVDSLPAAAFRKDAAGRYEFVNYLMCQNEGRSAESFLGRTAHQVAAERIAEAAPANHSWSDTIAQTFGSTDHHSVIMRTGRTIELDEEWVGTDGRRRFFHAVKTPVRGADGAIIGSQGVLFEITARKEAEAALSESEERFRRLIENASDVITVLDDAGRVEFQSPSAERVLGYPPAETLGLPVLNFIHPEDRAKVTGGIARARGQILPAIPVEYRIRHRDGSWRIFESVGKFMSDPSGPPLVVVNSRDITEARQLQEQFLRAQRLEAVGTLASGIAHDLNNILTPMRMIVLLLRERLPSESDREMLAMIDTGAQRGANIIRQLLTFSRGIEGERGPVQLRHLLQEMAVMMQETFPREISVVKILPADLWPVLADATQLHQVLMNLCVNARDAMPTGGQLTLSAQNIVLGPADVARHPQAKPGRHLMLTVSDTGTGIPAAIIDRIFEPFFTTKGIGKGTGLGLSTVIGIVKSHDGFVTVVSELGQGTAFKVHLPADPSLAGSIVPEAPTVVRGCGQLVLVVDDEEAIRTSLRRVLEDHGYRVMLAAHGEEALKVFAQHRAEVRVLLTDLMMPGVSGYELSQAVRAIDADVPIVVMSGLQDRERSDELAAQRVTESIAKPCSVEEVLRVLEKILPAAD